MMIVPRPLALLLSLVGSVLSYIVLQVIALFVTFFLYGEGQTYTVKSGTVSVWFVAVQMAAAVGLFSYKVWLKTRPTFLIALLSPIALFFLLKLRE